MSVARTSVSVASQSGPVRSAALACTLFKLSTFLQISQVRSDHFRSVVRPKLRLNFFQSVRSLEWIFFLAYVSTLSPLCQCQVSAPVGFLLISASLTSFQLCWRLLRPVTIPLFKSLGARSGSRGQRGQDPSEVKSRDLQQVAHFRDLTTTGDE